MYTSAATWLPGRLLKEAGFKLEEWVGFGRVEVGHECPFPLEELSTIRHLLLGSKARTNLDSVVKSRNCTFLTKVHVLMAKVMVFTLVMYGCES